MMQPPAPNVSTGGDGALPAGARFGPYRLLERIGHGGMAVVYRAKLEGPSGFEKPVVIKTLLPQLAHDPTFVELFTAEARTSARLNHPGIVHVFDFGILGGTPYLVMEYLAGVNLAQLASELRAQGRRLPADIAIVMITQVCHALGHAHLFHDADGHRQQIIHGDVSPANILACRDGTVKLLDFGVARVLDEFGYDQTSTLKGKFAYMAPERIMQKPFDRRVDVFAAGIVLYELLTQRRLFAGANDVETLQRVHAARVEPPSRLNPEVTPAVDAVVLQALSRDPEHRFDNGEAMAEALEEVTRIGGGRRRVAEYLATVFPQDWYVPCRACGRRVVPGMACRNCGREEAPRRKPPTLPAITVGPPAQPLVGRPPSLTRIVLPPHDPEPPRRGPRPYVLTGLGLALLGLSVAGGAMLVQRAHDREAAVKKLAAAATFPSAPPAPALSIDNLRIVELPPAPEPPPAETAAEPAPEPAPPPPRRPHKKHGRPKHAQRAVVPPSAPVRPQPQVQPQPPAPPERIKNGKLLDPFTREVE